MAMTPVKVWSNAAHPWLRPSYVPRRVNLLLAANAKQWAPPSEAAPDRS